MTPLDLGPDPAPPHLGLIDGFGRAVRYLRLSVTDRCDLRCTYCMAERMRFLPRAEVLSLNELDRIAAAFIDLGVTKLRVTGGEPLVRRDILSLFERLSRHLASGALQELTLTTNGARLAPLAADLARCGVRRVNVSLDTLDPGTYRRLTRGGDIGAVLAGIAAAKDAGLAVKINAVALKRDNAAQLPHLIEWAHRQSLDVTLIETMPLGAVDEDRTDQFLSLKHVRAQLTSFWTHRPAPADGRPGALCSRRGDGRAPRLHHPADSQLLRRLQPGAPDLHRDAAHLPGR
jgi:cyclic pyranopterin phosphate synthase